MSIKFKEKLAQNELQQLADYLGRGNKKHPFDALTGVHGFLSGMAISLKVVEMDKWLNILNCKRAPNTVRQLFARFYTQIQYELTYHEKFIPMLWEQNATAVFDDVMFNNELITDWCKGFLAGTKLDTAWAHHQFAVLNLLPFAVLANEIDLKGRFEIDGHIVVDELARRASFKESLPTYIKEIFTYWETARENFAPISHMDDNERYIYQLN